MQIPVQYTYFVLNITLLLVALRILGWRFCVRTIFSVMVFTLQTSLFQSVLAGQTLFVDQPFLACVIGGALLGIGTGIALQYNASTGGSDVIAAMINKHHDVSLGKRDFGLRPDNHHFGIRCFEELGEHHLRLHCPVCHDLRCGLCH